MPNPYIEFAAHYTCPACAKAGTLRPNLSCLDINGEPTIIAVCAHCLVQANMTAVIAHHDGLIDNMSNQTAARDTIYSVEVDNVDAIRKQIADNMFLTDLLATKRSNLKSLVYLDVGYGAGYSLYAATERMGHVMGVDLYDDSIRNICAAVGEPTNLELKGDIAALSQPADVVILWHTLEHIPNCPEFIGALRTKMLPSGCILLQVPLFQPRAVVDVHFSFFGLASLRSLFFSTGFEEEDYWFDNENGFVTYMAKLPAS